MSTNRQILKNLLQRLKEQYTHKRANIGFIVSGSASSHTGEVWISNGYSCILVEDEIEGLYYDPSDQVFFYSGEVWGLGLGGEAISFDLTGNDLLLVEESLQAILIQVATTKGKAFYRFPSRKSR